MKIYLRFCQVLVWAGEYEADVLLLVSQNGYPQYRNDVICAADIDAGRVPD